MPDKNRRVNPKCLVTRAKDLIVSSIARNCQLMAFEAKTHKSEEFQQELVDWLDVVHQKS